MDAFWQASDALQTPLVQNLATEVGDFIFLSHVTYHTANQKWGESISVSYLPDRTSETCGFAAPVKKSAALKNALALTDIEPHFTLSEDEDLQASWKQAVPFKSDTNSFDKFMIFDGTVTAVKNVQMHPFSQVCVRPSFSTDAAPFMLNLRGSAIQHVFGISEGPVTGDDVSRARQHALGQGRLEFLLQPGQAGKKQAVDARRVDRDSLEQ